MPATLTPEQQTLIELAARVPLQEVATARRLPPDDEPVTAEDLASIESAHKGRRNSQESIDQVRQDLGL